MTNPRQSIGHIKEITSVSNPIIKAIKGLHQKKNRETEGLFLAEGLKLVTDALLNSWQMKTLIYAKNISDQKQLQDIALKARAKGTDILEVSEKVLGSITRRDNPQMVVGIFHQNWTPLNKITPTNIDLWIALDRVRDPGNLGTIIRTADCAGAKGVLLIGNTTDPWSLEATRATMGSIFNIKLARCSSEEFINWRKNWSGLLVGTHLEGAVDYRSVNYQNQPVMVLMGNEQQGLSEEMVELCTQKVIIPMSGKADSLNLAIATAIMAFEVKRHALSISGE